MRKFFRKTFFFVFFCALGVSTLLFLRPLEAFAQKQDPLSDRFSVDIFEQNTENHKAFFEKTATKKPTGDVSISSLQAGAERASQDVFIFPRVTARYNAVVERIDNALGKYLPALVSLFPSPEKMLREINGYKRIKKEEALRSKRRYLATQKKKVHSDENNKKLSPVCKGSKQFRYIKNHTTDFRLIKANEFLRRKHAPRMHVFSFGEHLEKNSPRLLSEKMASKSDFVPLSFVGFVDSVGFSLAFASSESSEGVRALPCDFFAGGFLFGSVLGVARDVGGRYRFIVLQAPVKFAVNDSFVLGLNGFLLKSRVGGGVIEGLPSIKNYAPENFVLSMPMKKKSASSFFARVFLEPSHKKINLYL